MIASPIPDCHKQTAFVCTWLNVCELWCVSGTWCLQDILCTYDHMSPSDSKTPTFRQHIANTIQPEMASVQAIKMNTECHWVGQECYSICIRLWLVWVEWHPKGVCVCVCVCVCVWFVITVRIGACEWPNQVVLHVYEWSDVKSV